jgi:hypothetical protein
MNARVGIIPRTLVLLAMNMTGAIITLSMMELSSAANAAKCLMSMSFLLALILPVPACAFLAFLKIPIALILFAKSAASCIIAMMAITVFALNAARL